MDFGSVEVFFFNEFWVCGSFLNGVWGRWGFSPRILCPLEFSQWGVGPGGGAVLNGFWVYRTFFNGFWIHESFPNGFWVQRNFPDGVWAPREFSQRLLCL